MDSGGRWSGCREGGRTAGPAWATQLNSAAVGGAHRSRPPRGLPAAAHLLLLPAAPQLLFKLVCLPINVCSSIRRGGGGGSRRRLVAAVELEKPLVQVGVGT